MSMIKISFFPQKAKRQPSLANKAGVLTVISWLSALEI
jgi:hypothetical protein